MAFNDKKTALRKEGRLFTLYSPHVQVELEAAAEEPDPQGTDKDDGDEEDSDDDQKVQDVELDIVGLQGRCQNGQQPGQKLTKLY